MKENPYKPPGAAPTTAVTSRIPRLNGFALGVRDALVLSLPFVLMVAMVSQSYGASYLSTARDVVVIPLIWAPCAGLVAELKYRRRAPNASERQWIEWSNIVTTRID